jgi:hypothetical protein
MHRRKATIAVAALFAIGAAFAAERTSLREDWGEGPILQNQEPWIPGTNSLMSAHDPDQQILAPPQ